MELSTRASSVTKALVSSHSTGNQEHLLSLNKPCFDRGKLLLKSTNHSLFVSQDPSASSDVLEFRFSVKNAFVVDIQTDNISALIFPILTHGLCFFTVTATHHALRQRDITCSKWQNVEMQRLQQKSVKKWACGQWQSR